MHALMVGGGAVDDLRMKSSSGKPIVVSTIAGSGYRTAAETAVRAQTRIRTAVARLCGLLVGAVAVGGMMDGDTDTVVLACVALAVTALGFQLLHRWTARTAAADRLIELEGLTLAQLDRDAARIVERRRRRLVSARHRRSLASAVRRGIHPASRFRPDPPAVAVLRERPALAHRIAAQLEHDVDERLIVLVSRLLASGRPD